MASTATFTYNYQKISLKDIADFLESEGYKLVLDQEETDIGRLRVKDTEIAIRPPLVYQIMEGRRVPLISDILFSPFGQLYRKEEDGQTVIDKERVEVDRKLYQKLKRKFQMSKDDEITDPKDIKDLDWILHLRDYYNEQGKIQ